MERRTYCILYGVQIAIGTALHFMRKTSSVARFYWPVNKMGILLMMGVGSVTRSIIW